MVELTISSAGVDLSPGNEVILRHQTWADYEELLQLRQDNAAVKVRYNARTQEIRIMTPLPEHGNYSDVLSDLVKALLRHSGQDWQSFHPITLKRFGQAGLEPDTCFYIRNREAILGKKRIDLDTDPPPDLALEVDATSSSSPRLTNRFGCRSCGYTARARSTSGCSTVNTTENPPIALPSPGFPSAS